MINTIITQLKTIIGGISDVKVVYDVEPKEITTYPAVTIVPIGHEDEYLNLRDTIRRYNIMIRVWGELTATHEETQRKVRGIASTIAEKITNQTNIALSANIDFTLLTTGEAKFVKGKSDYYVYEIKYTASTRQNRTA